MSTQPVNDETEVQRKLRQLFNAAAAMSLAVVSNLDAEREMRIFLDAVKQHPEERPFVTTLFLDSFSDSFYMRTAPTGLLMYCMSELRWQEIFAFVKQQRDDDVEKHGVAWRSYCERRWSSPRN